MKQFQKLKFSVIAIFILAFIFNAKGQTTTYAMPVAEGSKIKQISKFGDKGFVILTAHQLKMGNIQGKIGDLKLACFNSDLKNVWTYEPAGDEYENFLVSSEASKYVYWCSYGDGNNKQTDPYEHTLIKNVSMTRFNEAGKPEKLQMQITEIAKNTDILAACMDESRFYMISHKIPDYRMLEDRTDVVYLNYMGHDETKLTRKKVAIDFSKGGQVNFLGINDGKLYFSQQRFLTKGMMKIDIYIVDSEGELLENFSIQPSIKGQFKSHFYNRTLEGGFAYQTNYFFDGSNINVSTENRFGELKVNFKTNQLYFCAYSEDDKQKFNTFLFETYTLNGEKVNKAEIPYLASFENQEEYNYKRLVQANMTYVTLLDSATVKVTSVGFNIASVIIIKDGDITGKYVFGKKHPRNAEYDRGDLVYGKHISYEEENGFNLYVNPAFAPKSFSNYMKTVIPGQPKSVSYSAITVGEKYVLFRYIEQKKGATLEFVLFE
jgi:hypothetical protein